MTKWKLFTIAIDIYLPPGLMISRTITITDERDVRTNKYLVTLNTYEYKLIKLEVRLIGSIVSFPC